VERIRGQGCNQEFQIQAFTVHTKCKEGLIIVYIQKTTTKNTYRYTLPFH